MGIFIKGIHKKLDLFAYNLTIDLRNKEQLQHENIIVSFDNAIPSDGPAKHKPKKGD